MNDFYTCAYCGQAKITKTSHKYVIRKYEPLYLTHSSLCEFDYEPLYLIHSSLCEFDCEPLYLIHSSYVNFICLLQQQKIFYNFY